MAEEIKNPELETISPLVAGAAGNNVNQAKMAGTDQTKAGVAGIPSNNVRKPGENINGAIPTSKPSVWSAPQPAKVVTQKETQAEGLSDIDRTKLVTETRKQTAEDKRLAQENLEKSQSLSQLGAVGESIKRVLQGNINQIFDAKGAIQGADIAAIGSSEELMSEMRTGLADKAKYKRADGTEVSGVDAVNAIMQDITDADKILDGIEGRAKTTGAAATDEVDSAAATAKMNEAISALAMSMGDADGNLSFDDVRQIFPDTNKLMGTLAATSLADKVLVDDRLLTDVFTDEDGVPDQAELDKVKGMLGLTGKETVTELRQKIDNYMGTEFKAITDLEDTVRDTTRAPEERRQALEQLRDMGYTGAMASREEVTKTADSIRDFDEGEISFLGNTYASLSDALSDESIMGAVSDYLTGNLDRDKIPGPLADFIDNNKTTFEAAMTEMEKEIGDFQSRQEQWKEIKSLFPAGDPASKAVLDMLGFKDGQPYQTGVLNVKDKPALNAIINKQEPAASQARDLITRLQANKISPEISKNILTGLSTDDIAKLSGSAELMTDYINTAAFSNKIKNITARDSNGDGSVTGIDMLIDLFKDDAPGAVSSLNSLLENASLFKSSGLLPEDMQNNIDKALTLATTLGSIGKAEDMSAALNNLFSASSFSSVDAFKNANSVGDVLTSISTAVQKATTAFGTTLPSLADAIRKERQGEAPTTTLADGTTIPTLLYSAEQAGLIKPIKGNDASVNSANLAGTIDFIKKAGLPPDKAKNYMMQVVDQAGAPAKAVLDGLLANTDRINPAALTRGDREAFSGSFATLSDAMAKGIPGAREKVGEMLSTTFNNRISTNWNDIVNVGQRIGGTSVSDVGLSSEELKALGVTSGGFLNSNLRSDGKYFPARQTLLEGYETYNGLTGQTRSADGFKNYIKMLKATRGSVL